jgi:2-polyprenyl-3-methyl-5-hydroxy-6-metoxy-1,4-benzoquinol methylase
MEEINCSICKGLTKDVLVKEQMMGTNEIFAYVVCDNCGHATLKNMPTDMSAYYSSDSYYSFNTDKINFTKKIIAKFNLLLLKLNLPQFTFLSQAALVIFSNIKLKKDSTILDYGCGNGKLVSELLLLQQKNVMGFDLYLPNANNYSSQNYLTNDINIIKQKKWDLICLHHVFEHLPSPQDFLKFAHSILSEDGKLILRFPVIDSYAYKTYKENWVQFDAPRHINLYTRKSFTHQVKELNLFSIDKMYDDSTHFQFTGSELYLKGMSLHQASKSRIKRILNFKNLIFHFKAKSLNKKNQGDQIVVILSKK